MTAGRREKKAARERMAREGINYTTALRRNRDDRAAAPCTHDTSCGVCRGCDGGHTCERPGTCVMCAMTERS